MPVKIRNMSKEEFDIFYQWSIEHNTAELMEERGLSRDTALKETKEEVSQMLPKGLDTEHHHLLSIVETDCEKVVGFLWTIHEETNGRQQCFICDFAIWESERRKGYAKRMLSEALMFCRENGHTNILITCNSNNYASERTILANGGVLENEIIIDGNCIKRYWVSL